MSSAPPKPWETQQGTGVSTGSLPSDFTAMDNVTNSRLPPPLPPRVQDSSYPMSSGYGSGLNSGYSSFGGLGSGYGGGMYGGGMYGSGYGGGMYGGGYGGGYGGMNRFGMNGMNGGQSQNSLVRQAEESSRQAFQSIESIVQAFGSVAMMLESTFHAVYNSFRAVIGVADHFTRMKLHFSQIFSAMALLRTLKWLYHKLMVLLRMREGGLKEDIWKEASSSAEITELSGKRKASWPILLFFGVVIGGPWIIWKILSSMSQSGEEEKKQWSTGETEHFQAVAEHDYQGRQEDELAFSRGQKIIIAPADLQPRTKGWLLASVDGKHEGLIPANYVKILGKRKGTAARQEGRLERPSAVNVESAWKEGQNGQKDASNDLAWESSSSADGSAKSDSLKF